MAKVIKIWTVVDFRNLNYLGPHLQLMLYISRVI